jgi:uncharacterized damage-inducible protein DinB
VFERQLTTWQQVRRMTLQFLDHAGDGCLDLRPGADFMTIREQAAHLSEAQGVFQLVLRGEPADFGRGGEFSPASLAVPDIVAALAERDRELADLLRRYRPGLDRATVAVLDPLVRAGGRAGRVAAGARACVAAAAAATRRLDWNRPMSLADFLAHHVHHEGLHQGQWAAYAALGGFERPPQWVGLWGL